MTFNFMGEELPSEDGVVTISGDAKKRLLDKMGLGEAHRTISCVAPPIGCGRELTAEEIASWDDLSRKEYTMSGLCKTPCQDKVFGSDEDDDYPEPNDNLIPEEDVR